MTSARIQILRRVLEQGVGTEIIVDADRSGLRTGLRSYFAGLTVNQGPVFSVTPSGLQRHRVTMYLGKFSSECIIQMQGASDERKHLARALVATVSEHHEVVLQPSQSLEDWDVTGTDFSLHVTVRDVASPASDAALALTARTVMVPLMAAMAELIGYDEPELDVSQLEGGIVRTTINRRERSPRNRLLCLSIHGDRCAVCGLVPVARYGRDAGDILEVHHLEPLSMLSTPRPYNPRADLVPLCPNCHRAVHARRPTPYSVEELKERMIRQGD